MDTKIQLGGISSSALYSRMTIVYNNLLIFYEEQDESSLKAPNTEK
jgi:hypothetical protein